MRSDKQVSRFVHKVSRLVHKVLDSVHKVSRSKHKVSRFVHKVSHLVHMCTAALHLFAMTGYRYAGRHLGAARLILLNLPSSLSPACPAVQFGRQTKPTRK